MSQNKKSKWITGNIGLGLNKHTKHQWGKKFKRSNHRGSYRACKTYGCCAWQILNDKEQSFMELLK